jgi:hypothetical protein
MADIKQMPLRMPVETWEAARRLAGSNSLNAWIVDLIRREVAAKGKAAPEPSLLDPQPTLPPGQSMHDHTPLATGGIVSASLHREARASVALDGETQSLPTPEEVEASTTRHLHRFKDTGRVLRYDKGSPIKERQCECGVVAT